MGPPTSVVLILALTLGSMGTLAQKPTPPVMEEFTEEPDADNAMRPEFAGPGIIRPQVKPGTCPLPVNENECDLSQRDECRSDRHCRGKLKCCSNGCRKRCLLPLEDKDDSCPFFDASICVHVRPLPDECSSDNQCQGTERCCCYNCRLACKPTVIVKPGQCPAPNKLCSLLPPKHECETDGGCKGKQKCCENCGRKCTTPKTENPGFCPVSIETVSCFTYLWKPKCQTDQDCRRGQKCCLSRNRMECVPALIEKPGTCPIPVTRCRADLRPTKPKCTSDKDCPGDKKCCTPECEPRCIDPNEFAEP
ncbi:WAP four-disulfide core domain protein 3-like [Xenopus laevis]|uniref:WAP four-disulfide core domain protein 3-like n=1 Tax=Xenopus laevis TaxID=8355 RepID=A0A8J1KQQ0_XENLA|nr:WAP four-disulfide core domain protein 3-like [Xenopus laevis]XP_041419642.1 WAP four-disulfide core domain protein 3-like [Xenopus laevis]